MISDCIISAANTKKLQEYADKNHLSVDVFLTILLEQYAEQEKPTTQEIYREEIYNRLMEALFDKAIFAILIINNDAEIVHVNDKAAELLAYSHEELVTLTIWDILPSGSMAEARRHWEYFLEQGELKGDFQLKTHDERVIDIEFSAMSNILPHLHFSVFQDVTERKQAERLEMELRKEKELHELKSHFLSVVTHEFRTPMTVIVASAALLKDFYEKLTPEQRNLRLEKIQSQIKHLAALLDEMTFLNRTKTKGLQLNIEPVEDWAKIIQEVIEDIQVVHSNKVDIEMEIVGKTCGFRSDLFLLQQILINLIGNAVKYSKEGGKVIIHCYCEPLAVRLSIQDSGIGIAPEDQNHLFEAFYRASNVDGIPGTGLGLVIVQQAVEAHHGTIQFTSELNNGTTFQVHLPSLGQQV